jgi:hypothetical protein
MSSPRSKVGASRISVNINAQQNRLTKNLGEKHDPWVILDDQGHKLVDELSSLQIQKSELKSKAFTTRYKAQTKTKMGFFQTIMKFFETDNIEITKETHLPLMLLHYQFKRPKRQEEIQAKK